MGASVRGVNVVGVGGANPEKMKFDAMYDEEVKAWKLNEKRRLANERSVLRIAKWFGDPDTLRRLIQPSLGLDL
uniref:Uncharacterized protein n=1 Tax=Solanum tuberosum TaxID=4113 RepID=M1DQS2_SOLTU